MLTFIRCHQVDKTAKLHNLKRGATEQETTLQYCFPVLLPEVHKTGKEHLKNFFFSTRFEIISQHLNCNLEPNLEQRYI